MSLPKDFIRGGSHYLEHIGGKARICRTLHYGVSRYSLFKRTVTHRGHAHWTFTGVVTDSANDAASAYQYNAEPLRRKA